MPELPEVEVVRAGLDPAMRGAIIHAVTVHDSRALTRHALGGADFERRLTGQKVAASVRRGKFLWFPLVDTGTAIVGHLGMSGQLLLRPPGAELARHERIRLDIEHPEHGEVAVLFVDQRTFGSLALDDLVPTQDGAAGGLGSEEALVPSQVAHIARDPLDPAFDESKIHALLSKKSSAIKRLLLDQNVLSGVGNIYADEALWAAELHPETPAHTLSAESVTRLLAEVREVLLKALAEGGTSFDAQYVNVNGQAGYFAHSLNAYGQQGKPCDRCGTSIVRERFMNRGSHFCPKCQRVR